MTTYNKALVSDVKITVTDQMVGGQIYFQSTITGLKPGEAALLASVNLSRGRNRQFRLDNLSAHNGGGANWSNPNDGIHSTAAQYNYTKRVSADLAAAWETSKAAIAAARTPKPVYVAPTPPPAAKVFFMANGV